ncbi:hypothetical protein [Paucilactobacillus suebicus]|nr:hypothetical protein [Paucilactobacillus suebicus]
MKSKFTTSLDHELIKQLKIQAVVEETTVGNILENIIKDYLSKNEDTAHID